MKKFTAKVSLILVFRNSESTIRNALQSYISQDYPSDLLEIVLVDGESTDLSNAVAKDFISEQTALKDSQFKFIDNPNKILATGWNLGILEATGEYVCRIDVHSTIPEDYISKLVDFLDNCEATVAGAGGSLVNSSTSSFGDIAVDFYSSKFGVGNSPFRVERGTQAFSSDTAVFAVYRKSVFNEFGGFNELLGRNQDIEFHKRILSNGKLLYTLPYLKCIYNVRSDYISFVKKAYNDGFWVVRSKSFYLRHLVPMLFLLFVLTVLILSLKFNNLLYLLLPYLVLCVLFSIKDGRKLMNKISLSALYLSYHLSYGFGSTKAILLEVLKK